MARADDVQRMQMALGLGAGGADPRRARPPRSLQAQILQFADGPPPGAWWFDKCLTITLGASASRPEIVAFALRAGYCGLLRFFANWVQNSAEYPSVTFALLVDGTPVQGYASIVGPKSPSLAAPDPLILPLLPGQRISVVATNATVLAISGVGARIKGWAWPTTLFNQQELEALG